MISIGNIDVDRPICVYLNERILDRPTEPSTRTLNCTHDIAVTDEKSTTLEDVVMTNEDVDGTQY